LFLVILSSATFASSKVSLIFPDAAEKSVFVSGPWPVKDPSQSTRISAQKLDYTIDSGVATDKLFVVDIPTGKVAVKPIGEIKNNTWTIGKEEFSTLYKVRVEVSTPKGPVAAATVDFESGTDKRNELIDPSSAGAATFYFVKAGEVKVAVNYKVGGKSKDPVRQNFTVGGDKEAVLKIALPEGDAIAPPAGAAAATSNEPAKSTKEKDSTNDEKPKDPGSPLGGLLSTLFGLIVMGGVIYLVVMFIRKNPDQVKATLTKLGADIPVPGDPNAHSAEPSPVTPIAPQPMQQIILDGGAPSPIAMPAAPVAQIQMSTPAAAPTGVLRLVASDGSAFNLPDGETIVGREFGAGLVVPNDSVSRKHASLTKNGMSIELTDHGSTNGTWINGGKLSGSQMLRPGDSIRFGSIEYRFEG
jgi:hypothetical protein